MNITCAHPNCDHHLSRGRLTCGRHWYALNDYLREQSKIQQKNGPSAIEALQVHMESYFRSRMIGDNEVVKCRGSSCGADIVWLDMEHGRKKPVDVKGVEASDRAFDYTRHTAHAKTCKNPDEFRRG